MSRFPRKRKKNDGKIKNSKKSRRRSIEDLVDESEKDEPSRSNLPSLVPLELRLSRSCCSGKSADDDKILKDAKFETGHARRRHRCSPLDPSNETSSALPLPPTQAPPALILARPSRAIADDEADAPSTAPIATPTAPQQEDLPPFVRDALKRTEENRERRRIERLRAYDRKNFGDYFDFDSGFSGAMRGVKPETRKAIEKWLQENK